MFRPSKPKEEQKKSSNPNEEIRQEVTPLPQVVLPPAIRRYGTGIQVTVPPITDHSALSGLSDDDHEQYYNSVRHTKAIHDALGLDHAYLSNVSADQHHPQAHTLASHSTKAHSELTGVGINDHHNKVHALAHVDHPDVSISSPANNEVLTYESATALWKNKAPTGGGGGDLSMYRYRKSGRYHASGLCGSVSSIPFSSNTIRAWAFFVPTQQVFDRIGINVTTAGAGLARLGVYADDGTIYPGDLLLDSGAIDVSTIGAKEITIDLTLQAGLYWMVMLNNVSITLDAFGYWYTFAPIGAATPGTYNENYYYKSYTYAALPSTFPSGASSLYYYVPVMLRKA